MNIQVASPSYDKKNPFLARLTNRKKLNLEGSNKDTQHFEVDISGSGLTYECGDSLGIYVQNDPQAIKAVLASFNFTGKEMVQLPKQEGLISLGEALLSHLAINQPTLKSLTFLEEKVESESDRAALARLLSPENAESTKEHLLGIEWIDLAEEFSSAKISAQDFVDQLKKLVPRLYSIASSPTLYPDSIHLTIGVVRYETNNRQRKGIASTFLAERVDLNTSPVPCFVAKSHFNLPQDPAIDIIMVGPGTGVAPFRAFIQERVTQKSTGRSWLFFGDQHKSTDFLYQTEWERYLASGELTRMDLAFSRDQKEKIYVQDKMKENAAEIWNWIQNGAHFYVCGDSKKMAPDVDSMLHSICAKEGNMTDEEASQFIKELKKKKRYQRDIY